MLLRGVIDNKGVQDSPVWRVQHRWSEWSDLLLLDVKLIFNFRAHTLQIFCFVRHFVLPLDTVEWFSFFSVLSFFCFLYEEHKKIFWHPSPSWTDFIIRSPTQYKYLKKARVPGVLWMCMDCDGIFMAIIISDIVPRRSWPGKLNWVGGAFVFRPPARIEET